MFDFSKLSREVLIAKCRDMEKIIESDDKCIARLYKKVTDLSVKRQQEREQISFLMMRVTQLEKEKRERLAEKARAISSLAIEKLHSQELREKVERLRKENRYLENEVTLRERAYVAADNEVIRLKEIVNGLAEDLYNVTNGEVTDFYRSVANERGWSF